MSDNRNKLWSDVLAYRPLHEMTKRKQTIKTEQISKEVNEQTPCFADYNTYNSYRTMVSVKDSISKINDIISLIESSVDDITLLREESELDSLIEDNKGIDGNFIYEVYKVIKKDNEMLSNLNSKFKEMNFGDVTDLEAERINNANIATIKDYELTGKYEKINYTNLAYDSYVNSMIGSYAEDVVNSASKLFTTVTINPSLGVVGDSDSMKSIIENKYSKVLDKSYVDLSHYNDFVDNNTVTSIYNKTCILRKNMNTAINADVSVPKYEDDVYVSVIMQLKDEAIEEAFNGADDLMKGMLLSIIKKDDYIKSLAERQGLKNIFLGIK